MPYRLPTSLHFYGTHSSSLNHQRKFSTILPHFQESITHEHGLLNLLHNLCSKKCKKPHSRHLFDQMPQRLDPSLNSGKAAHARSLRLGVSDGRIGNAILDLYAKCGHGDYAEKVFSGLVRRDEYAWNSIMVMYSRKGMFKDVLRDFSCMWGSGVLGNQFSSAVVLSASGRLMDVQIGKQIHCIILKTGVGIDAYCEGALVDMYAKCGLLTDAKRVFDEAVEPGTISCTALISGFAQAGFAKEAMDVFEEMRRAGHVPDHILFGTVLNTFVGQGMLEDAWNFFLQVPNPNAVAWNIMISGHVRWGNEGEAIKVFKNMMKAGNQPTQSTFGSLLRAIATVVNNEYGLQVHAQAVKQGLDSSVYVGSSLINMYAKCQKLEAAKMVFDRIEEKHDFLWNTLIGGYAQNGRAREVLELFFDMKLSGSQPDEYTYTSILSACACLENMHMGRQLHSFIIKSDFGVNAYVFNALMDMYAKCGALSIARQVFEQIRYPDLASWNAIIVGCVQGHEEKEAFYIFREMMCTRILPDEVSLATLLSATANLKDISKGRQLHCFVLKCGLEEGIYAGSSLIDMYCKCGIVEAAAELFSYMPERSLVGVNALISGFAQLHLGESVKILKRMLAEGMQPSEVTFATLLRECTNRDTLNFGRQMHSFIIKLGLTYLDEFLAVSLLSMYMNSQRDTDTIVLFHEILHPKTTAMWTVLISGSTQNNHGEDAIHWYQVMRCHDVMPDQATFVSVLRACSSLVSLQEGQKIHAVIVHSGYANDELTGSVLVDMYAKCGDVKSSAEAFGEMTSKKDVVSWNSMIVGYAENGYAESALNIFDEMKQEFIEPDEVTFLGVLTACSHAGMVSEGRDIYHKMISHYGIQPRVEHCACMIDLLGRWGYLSEVDNFIENLGFEPDSMIWATYLNACKLHNDDVRGQLAAEKLIQLEPENSSSYVLLSSIHAASGNWDRVNFVRKEMKQRGVKKVPGCSWIVIGDRTHFFVAGDRNHLNAGQILELLKDMVHIMKDRGLVSESNSVVLEEDQDFVPCPFFWTEAEIAVSN